MAIKTRKQVDHETTPLAKAQACAEVMMAMVGGSQPALDASIAQLRLLLGSQWTAQHAVQFLSGKAGHLAIQDARAPEVRDRLVVARRLAQKAIASAWPATGTVPLSAR